jgi:hypothetical protein
VSPWSRRREPLSAITGTLSAIDRNGVRDQSESLSAFAGIRSVGTRFGKVARPEPPELHFRMPRSRPACRLESCDLEAAGRWPCQAADPRHSAGPPEAAHHRACPPGQPPISRPRSAPTVHPRASGSPTWERARWPVRSAALRAFPLRPARRQSASDRADSARCPPGKCVKREPDIELPNEVPELRERQRQ